MELMDVEMNDNIEISVENELGESSLGVALDPETARAVYTSAWAELGKHLTDVNDIYNDGAEGVEGDHWDRVRALQDSLETASKYAGMIVTLTAIPVPDTPEEED